MNPVEREIAERLGVTVETIESLRKHRLTPGDHYTRDTGTGFCKPLQYTESGLEALRLRIEAGEKDYKVVRKFPNKIWVGIEVEGIVRNVEVRNSAKLSVGMMLFCCVLPEQVENLDKNHIPLRFRNRLV